ncbi:hypothetical protein KAR91_18160 [Candidatus Pacearchaeota archaeon]|nr:hypothetical protein [Candidatus Pacearchaeota archaeon]
MSKEIVSQNADDLSRVVQKALAQVETILDMDETLIRVEDRLRLMSIKKDAAISIVNAGLKADENRFRRENKDIIEKLYAKIEKSGNIIDGKVIKR